MSEPEITAIHAGLTCRTCGAPIAWAVSEAGGKSFPVDPTPVLGGNLHIVGERENDRGWKNPVMRGVLTDPLVYRFVSHFATCGKGAQR